jgi:RNA polymerase sigma factor (sigma-70 family)
MATASMSSFLRRLTRSMAAETVRDQSDRHLVERLVAGRDEAVFEAIVRRHGPMVHNVCWRVLQHEQDTEDAFQATFLILAQQLRSVRRHASLASWLHGVAHRVALKALARAATRRRHEQKSATEKLPPDGVLWRELRDVLDAELAHLPEKWRLPLVLCYLEGQTQDEAAEQLHWSQRTLRRRLAEAKAALARRLTRRGFVWPDAASAVLLSECLAPAALAPGLISSTLQAAACIATRQAALTTAVSANVAALTQGVLKTMFVSKIKMATAALVLLTALAVGAGGLLYRTQAVEPRQPPKAEKLPPQKEKSRIDVIGAGETAMELAKTTKDPDAKWAAIRILGSLRYERAIPLLLKSLSDPHHYVRANAARALGDMKVAAAAKPLTELLQKEKNGGVIQQTSLAVANLGCADALGALKGAAKHEDVQTRMWVLQAIGRLGDKRDVPFLAGYLLDDPSQSVQAFAAQAIEQITGADFGFPRRSGPSSPEEGLRRAKAWWAEHKGEYGRR